MIDGLVGQGAGLLVAGAITGWLYGRARRRRALAFEQEAPLAMPVALRHRSPGIRGRWRQGLIIRTHDDLLWRPRRPRIGRPIPLRSAQVLGARRRTRGEWWWISFLEDVLVVDTPADQLELAVHPAESDAAKQLLTRGSN